MVTDDSDLRIAQHGICAVDAHAYWHGCVYAKITPMEATGAVHGVIQGQPHERFDHGGWDGAHGKWVTGFEPSDIKLGSGGVRPEFIGREIVKVGHGYRR